MDLISDDFSSYQRVVSKIPAISEQEARRMARALKRAIERAEKVSKEAK